MNDLPIKTGISQPFPAFTIQSCLNGIRSPCFANLQVLSVIAQQLMVLFGNLAYSCHPEH